MTMRTMAHRGFPKILSAASKTGGEKLVSGHRTAHPKVRPQFHLCRSGGRDFKGSSGSLFSLSRARNSSTARLASHESDTRFRSDIALSSACCCSLSPIVIRTLGLARTPILNHRSVHLTSQASYCITLVRHPGGLVAHYETKQERLQVPGLKCSVDGRWPAIAAALSSLDAIHAPLARPRDHRVRAAPVESGSADELDRGHAERTAPAVRAAITTPQSHLSTPPAMPRSDLFRAPRRRLMG